LGKKLGKMMINLEVKHPEIPWKNRLQEYCHSRGLPLPIYNSRRNGKLWLSTARVNNITESGQPEPRKVDSEFIAAKRLFLKLLSSESPSAPLNLQPRENRVSSKEDRKDRPIREENEGGFFDLFARRIQELSTMSNSSSVERSLPPRSQEPELTVQQVVVQRERRFPNNIFDNELLDHLHIIIRGKNVEITNNPDYVSEDVPIVIHLNIRVSEIKTTLGSNSVRIDIPLMEDRASFQAMMLLSACMELGAASCSIVGLPSNRVDRIIMSERYE
jgi:hypothetical protein